MSTAELKESKDNVISVEEARVEIIKIADLLPVGKSFLKAFQHFSNLESLVGFERRNGRWKFHPASSFYLFGKSNASNEDGWSYELSLEADVITRYPSLVSEVNDPYLFIRISYGKPETDEVTESVQPSPGQFIPVRRKYLTYMGKKYHLQRDDESGAILSAEEKSLNPRWDVMDRRLEDYTRQIYNKIRELAQQSHT